LHEEETKKKNVREEGKRKICGLVMFNGVPLKKEKKDYFCRFSNDFSHIQDVGCDDTFWRMMSEFEI
jgi:hypothetical protein